MPTFMVLLGSHPIGESGQKPTPEQIAEFKPVVEYHDKLARDGKLIWADPLHPSKLGARVLTSKDGDVTVQKGPFEQTVGGFAIIAADSLDAVVAIIKDGPSMPGGSCEIREIIDMESHPLQDEIKAKAKEMRKLMQKNAANLQQ
ncbi:hypothetical protein EJ08DRAFT_675864 [Tothia fuscella]|uniref:YCII-related domain-containing protein n=1 Tax=Tothia fuscella TaxID=1048955 RepID=A0A9P4NYR9_9PEZI|nr:hypothetical protein EJ08DRAFT_675864 [Tothia fuscella]